jgi:DNA-binding MarR family transcriptional regulator
MDGDPVRPTADVDPLEVLLPRVGAAVARHQQRLAARDGLTPTAVAVLAALDPGDGPSHRELAARVGLSPATITPVLDRLEAAAEIRRERDPGDRRVVRVHRTAAGAARLSSAASRERWLPEPAPELEAAVRTWLLEVLVAAEADE